jgi:hypothetical protein
VTGSTPFADRRDSIYRSSGRGDQWALESSSGSCRRRSVSRDLSLGQSSRLHGGKKFVAAGLQTSPFVAPHKNKDRPYLRSIFIFVRGYKRPGLQPGCNKFLHGRATTPRHVGTDADSSSSVPLFERLDSGMSVSMASLHGVERAGRGVATPERSSSTNTVATIRSRIRPSSTPFTERSLRRSAVKA